MLQRYLLTRRLADEDPNVSTARISACVMLCAYNAIESGGKNTDMHTLPGYLHIRHRLHKQTVTLSVPQGGTHPVTWPAEITDRSVQWWTEDHYLLSIDRTTGILTGGVNGEAQGTCKRPEGKVF